MLFNFKIQFDKKIQPAIPNNLYFKIKFDNFHENMFLILTFQYPPQHKLDHYHPIPVEYQPLVYPRMNTPP